MPLKTCAMLDMTKNNHHWQIQTTATGISHRFDTTAQPSLKDALESCAAKAINLLDNNIQDDSLYLLFEWNQNTAELKIVVTDATKQRDANISVSAHFADLEQELQLLSPNDRQEKIVATNELVKFLLSDYLASCSAFFRYSLVAIFHASTRENSQLL